MMVVIKELAFQDIRSLLEHYEHNRIDPALRSTGKAYTEDKCRGGGIKGCKTRKLKTNAGGLNRRR
jgi:hypothetical protein